MSDEPPDDTVVPERPDNILAFDATPTRQPVDLDEAFFVVRLPRHPECDHKNRGVELVTSTRTVFCKCGVPIDAFDALLIYAHAERRLVSTRAAIAAHEQKEQDKRDRRPLVRAVQGFQATFDRLHRVTGWHVSLSCGHKQIWAKRGRERHPPRTMTCDTCVRVAKSKMQGVAPLSG